MWAFFTQSVCEAIRLRVNTSENVQDNLKYKALAGPARNYFLFIASH